MPARRKAASRPSLKRPARQGRPRRAARRQWLLFSKRLGIESRKNSAREAIQSGSKRTSNNTPSFRPPTAYKNAKRLYARRALFCNEKITVYAVGFFFTLGCARDRKRVV